MYNLLNPDQKKAVFYKDNHLLVLAGPGSGKTQTIIMRICHLLEIGVKEDSIVAITFTNRASNEMLNRLKSLEFYRKELFIGTIHKLGKKIIQEELNYNLKLVNYKEALKILKNMLLHENADIILQEISKVRNFFLKPSKEINFILKRYIEMLRKNDFMDIDDLLAIPTNIMNQTKLQKRLKHIIVDEFQDLNPLQYEFIKSLASAGAYVFAVGDDDQSIYSFKGISAIGFKRFSKDFSPSKTVILRQNYRNPKLILSAALHLINKNKNRIPKELFSKKDDENVPISVISLPNEKKEGEFIANTIKKRIGGTGYHDSFISTTSLSFSDFVILVRINAIIPPIKKALEDFGIPCKTILHKSLLDYESVQIVIAYIKVIIFPEDNESLKKIINIPPRGIGEKTFQKLIEKSEKENISFIKVVKKEANKNKKLNIFCKKLQSLKYSQDSLYDLINMVIKEFKLDIFYKKEQESLDKLLKISFGLKEKNLCKALNRLQEELIFYKQEDFYEPSAEVVYIMSIHAAKGLEFPIVFIAGAEDNILPLKIGNKESLIEEERRIMYVAMTRAKKELIITYCRERKLFGKKRFHHPSPFIDFHTNLKNEIFIKTDKKIIQQKMF